MHFLKTFHFIQIILLIFIYRDGAGAVTNTDIQLRRAHQHMRAAKRILRATKELGERTPYETLDEEKQRELILNQRAKIRIILDLQEEAINIMEKECPLWLRTYEHSQSIITMAKVHQHTIGFLLRIDGAGFLERMKISTKYIDFLITGCERQLV